MWIQTSCLSRRCRSCRLRGVVAGKLTCLVPSAFNDFVRAVQSARPTVTQDDIVKHLEFANEAGSEVSAVEIRAIRFGLGQWLTCDFVLQ